MRVLLAASALFVLGIAAIAQIDDFPTPTPVPFTREPKQLQWRIGFDLGNATILEAPDLNPRKDYRLAVQEAERVIPHPLLSYGLVLLPYSKLNVSNSDLVNPREWTVLDLHDKTVRKSFGLLGIFMGSLMTTTEGGYHLASLAAAPVDPFLGIRKEPSPDDVVFGFAGPMKGRIHLKTKLSETKWENSLPVEDPAGLPPGFEMAKQLLDDGKTEGQRFLFGTSIEAIVRKQMATLWLLNYSHPDTTKGSHPWGIFMEDGGGLQPLYIYKPSGTEDPFVAYFTAALDLNQDGNDELVVEASYRLGTAYKVISMTGAKYEEIFTSYYRGPEKR